MTQEAKILIGVPAVIGGEESVFYIADEKVTIQAPGELMRGIAELCDGAHTLSHITAELAKVWAHKPLEGLLTELLERKILIDYRFASEAVWKMVENPSQLLPVLSEKQVDEIQDRAQTRNSSRVSDVLHTPTQSPLKQIQLRRHSARAFTGEPLQFQNIVDIVWSTYGKTGDTRRTVPSAGALYPLQIHVAVFHDYDEFRAGIYHAFLEAENSIGFEHVTDDVLKLVRAYADPIMVERASSVIVISGEFQVTGEKYGNRSMLYVPLEAGHAAQNALLTSAELDVSSVEIGGFAEVLLADALHLKTGCQPLTTIVFGKEEAEPVEPLRTHWVTPMAGTYRPPFTIALARVGEELLKDWSYGRDVSPRLAEIKAHSEAREWAACSNAPNSLLRASLKELSSAIDPRSVVNFHSAQYRVRDFPFARFDEERKYLWEEGVEELTGRSVHILADLVYFSVVSDTPTYTYANSSGVAAHPHRQTAVETATLELVERDSFMNSYFAQLVLPTISHSSLSVEIRKRVDDLMAVGFDVWFKDHTLDLAPVISVFAQNKELAFTTCASCSRFDPQRALEHALMEVEAAVLARLQNGPSGFVHPREVTMPSDHGALYEHDPYFQRADFMFRLGKVITFEKAAARAACSWQQLLERFEQKEWKLLTVPLQLPVEFGGNNGLHIIRSIVPGMVPMTFGYRQEPAGMKRLYEMRKGLGQGEISYRDLRKLPHPFA